MISIICVYNNKNILENCLLKSLKNQTVKFELITLKNTTGQFKSAAEALNYGGGKATGRYIMFVHQDVELDSGSWLEKVEKLLDNIHNLGIAGVAGMSEKGKNFAERERGYISNCGETWRKLFQKPEEVQTLDECLLIVPKNVFDNIKFDEKIFDNWHCYGADYCLCVREKGLKAYVIPAFIYHRSLRLNTKELLKYQKRLYKKYQKDYKHIFLTTGEISWVKLIFRTIKAFFKPLYTKLFSSWIEDLKRELSDCNTVLDLGCGYNSPIQYCSVPFSVGVEKFESYFEESKSKKIHNQYIKADILKIEFKPKSFDAILCSEVIEHLTKEEGCKLIKKMEKWARKKIIITTPNGYLWQNGYDNNPLQEHKSGWSVKELERLGFKVFGMRGWKNLRGYKGSIKYKPSLFWTIVSDITQKITYYFPNLAFQLFAVKKIKKDNE